MTYPTILTYGQRWHEAIDDERHRQEKLKAEGRFAHTCRDQELTNQDRLAVLAEEFGEVARAVLERQRLTNDASGKELAKELVQVAAVCVAWLEGLEWEVQLNSGSLEGRDG